MSNFLQSAQGAFGNKAEELDDSSGGEDGSIKPREFFWDNIVLFVVSSIIGLAAIDVVTEFLRGGGVSCFSPLGVELSEAQGAFVNSYCAGFLPPGAYIPAFMVIHGVLIAVPHYLWLNHYGGNFNFFFLLTSSMKRLRDEESGEHVRENLLIVEQLETTFSTYRRNTIFKVYVLKLLFQLLWSLAGVLFVIWYFFEGFKSNFTCPDESVNITDLLSWPLEERVWCVFETLNLLQTLWLAEIGLLALVCFGLTWALAWCVSSHASELGAERVALFSFQSGLAPSFYVPYLPVPSCCKPCRRILLNFFTSIPWPSPSGPRIKTDLDFLLMRLHRTDSGLGHVFKEVQIEKELKILNEDDQRRLALHGSKQRDLFAKDDPRKKDAQDRADDEQDLKWKFPKEEEKLGIYRDFKTIPETQTLMVTNTMRGAVLAFGQRAPHNKNAINISFGDTGYATALTRVFQRVALLNFNPYSKPSDDVVHITQYRTHMVSLVFADNVLSSSTQDINKFIDKLGTVWVPPGSSPKFSETSFIVIGPIPKKKDFNITNVDLLLKKIHGCLRKGAVLLTIQPLEIAGKDVSKHFLSYEPTKPSFEPLEQEHPTFPEDRTSSSEWPARKSHLVSSRSAKATPTEQEQGDPGTIALQPLQSQQPTAKLLTTTSSSVTLESQGPHGSTLPFQFPITVRCGQSKCRVQFSTYYYTDDPPGRRPLQFDPPAAAFPGEEEAPSGLLKEKNVNNM